MRGGTSKEQNSIFSIHRVVGMKFNLNNFHWTFPLLNVFSSHSSFSLSAVHLTSSSLECVCTDWRQNNEREVKSYDLNMLDENIYSITRSRWSATTFDMTSNSEMSSQYRGVREKRWKTTKINFSFRLINLQDGRTPIWQFRLVHFLHEHETTKKEGTRYLIWRRFSVVCFLYSNVL